MNLIKEIATVSQWSFHNFERDLNKVIDEFQNMGYVLEIQMTNVYMQDRECIEYNALIIAREDHS